METKEKLLSTNVLDLIESSEKYKIEEYFPYLKCVKCLEIALEPRQCFTCNYVFCQKCKICSHPLILSRHVKLILDNITFKCKFNKSGCDAIIKYFDIRQHHLNCKFSETDLNSMISINSTNSMKSSAINKSSDSFYFEKNSSIANSWIYSSKAKASYDISRESVLFTASNFNHENYEGNLNVKCQNCGIQCSNKTKFMEHYKNCIHNKKQEDILNTFSYSHSQLENKFLSYMQDKLNERKKTQINKFNQYENLLENSRNHIKEMEEQILKFNNEDNSNDDPEYVEILKREASLNESKLILSEVLSKKIEEYNKILQENEKEIEMSICEQKNILLALELEEKWAKEELESSMFCSDFDDKCTICGNEEHTVKKYFCQSCRGKFCVDKCAKQCKAKECNKFICPKEGNDCKLCHKLNYCEPCKRKCFYQGCLNTFCPECYKKNEHQARNSNINCKFFTCEKDQICDCLMTSLFCSKCEKRLCNKCLMNDKEHFPFLK
jgi:hypothetical protein